MYRQARRYVGAIFRHSRANLRLAILLPNPLPAFGPEQKEIAVAHHVHLSIDIRARTSARLP